MHIPLYVVHDKTHKFVVNDEWSSLQFQQFISDKLGINVDDQIIYFSGKPLFGDIEYNLKQCGVSAGSNVFLNKKLRGGNVSGITMIIMTIILLLLFCILMILGLVPVWAHVFGCYIKKGLCLLFGKALKEGGFIGMILRYVMYAITFFIIGIFIYSMTGIAFFFLLFNKKQHFCSSVVIARYIALTLTAIFIVFYALFALPDFLGNQGLKLQNNSPIFFGALLTPIFNFIEWIADTGKFTIFFFIPFIGEFILEQKEALPEIVQFLYIFFGETKELSCSNEGFDIVLISMLEFFESTMGCVIAEEHNMKQILKIIFYCFEDDIRKSTNNGKLTLAQLVKQNSVKLTKGGKHMAEKMHKRLQQFKKFQADPKCKDDKYRDSVECQKNLAMQKKIKEFKEMSDYVASQSKKSGLSSMKAATGIGSSRMGSFFSGKKKSGSKDEVCNVYSTLKKYNKIKWDNYDYDLRKWKDDTKKEQEEYAKNPMPLDSVSSALLPLGRNIICSIFQIFPAVNNILNDCIGKPYFLVDLIENSQLAGVMTTIATIVIIILTFFLNKMYGYSL